MGAREKMRSALLYDGLSKDEYEAVSPLAIRESNNRILLCNGVAAILALGLLVLSFLVESLRDRSGIYLFCLVSSVLTVVLLRSGLQKNVLLSKIVSYYFISMVMFATMYIGTVTSGGLPAVDFMVALALIPFVTYTRTVCSVAHRLAFSVLFVVMSFTCKPMESVRADLINVVPVFVFSSIVGFHAQRRRMGSYVSRIGAENELGRMSGVFEMVRVIDLTTNSSVDFSTAGNGDRKILCTNPDARKQMDRFVEEVVSRKNNFRMDQFCSLATLDERMRSGPVLVRDFVSVDGEWIRAIFVSLGNDKDGRTAKVSFMLQKIADLFYLDMLDFDSNNII